MNTSSPEFAAAGLPAAWDSLPFSAAEYSDRLESVRAAMHRAGLDVLVVTSPDNAYYLTGYDSLGYYQFQAMVIQADRDAPWGVLHEVESGSARLSSWVTDIEFWKHDTGAAVGSDGVTLLIRRLADSVPASARIGLDFDGYFLSVSQFEKVREGLPTAQLVNSSRLIPTLRAIKSPAEVAYLRAAAALSDIGVTAAANAAEIGCREFEIKAAVDHAMGMAGSEYACLPPMISSGPKTLAVHQSASSRTVMDGDPITVGVAGSVRRYNSNILRTFLPRGSKPNPRFEAVYDVLVEATRRCTEIAGPGVPGAVLDRESRHITRDFDKYRLHRTGYGLEAGYPPSWMGVVSLSSNDPTVLQPGMVITIEPTFIFYDLEGADRFSAIMGNNILITEDGAETLNTVSPFLNR